MVQLVDNQAVKFFEKLNFGWELAGFRKRGGDSAGSGLCGGSKTGLRCLGDATHARIEETNVSVRKPYQTHINLKEKPAYCEIYFRGAFINVSIIKKC